MSEPERRTLERVLAALEAADREGYALTGKTQHQVSQALEKLSKLLEQ
jgi:hypothetical protein